MSKERYLVTGAAGFIGANLVHRLRLDGRDVIAAVQKDSDLWRLDGVSEITFVQTNICDPDSVKDLLTATRPSHIFHLATYGVYRHQRDPQLIFNTNVLGTFNLLNAARDLELNAFVNTGSVYEYSNLPGPQIESITGIPRNIYDAAKLASSQLAQAYATEYHLPITTLRLFTTYGPLEDESRLISSILSKLLYGEQPMIASSAIRDFVYIDDVTQAYLLAADLGKPGEIYNIGSGQGTRIGELFNQICQAVDSTITPIESESYLPINDSQCWANITKASTELNWRPSTELNSGLLNTIQWYKKNHSN